MSISLWIFTYLNVWWVTLFMVLPIGVKRVENPDSTHYAAAPEKPMMRKKVIITSLLALVFTCIDWVIGSGIINVRP